MEKFFVKAAENFARSISAEIDECKNIENNGYVTEIDIRGDENIDIYLILPKDVLDTVSYSLFGESDYDIEDLSKEIANLIVGNAKVLAGEENIYFDITIPKFHNKINIDYDKKIDLSINDKCFSILFKEAKET